jgi:hypothetical protein
MSIRLHIGRHWRGASDVRCWAVEALPPSETEQDTPCENTVSIH